MDLITQTGFDFGHRQNGIRVNHVTLPLWSKEDPRLFVLIHRQAIESDEVSEHLHKWIDLVFGFKQTGQAALDAVNVFHPATYFGMDTTLVEDELKRVALETMVKTYGQTPRKLFSQPHPPRTSNSDSSDTVSSSILSTFRAMPENKTIKKLRNAKLPRPLPSVKGIQWGTYLGSPAAPEPTVFLHKMVSGPIGSLAALQTNDVCALAPNMCLLVVYTKDQKQRGSSSATSVNSNSKHIDISWSSLLCYDKPDKIVRLKLKHNTPGINLCQLPDNDEVVCSAVAPDSRLIIFGALSGKLIVHRTNVMPNKSLDLEILPPVSLYCHTAKVTCLSVCGSFRIFVSGSDDETAAIWDLDSMSYIRSLTGHAGRVTSLAISSTCGDICTVCESGTGSHIRLWTINGSLVAAQDCRIPVRCVTFTNCDEGRAVNVLAGGLENGTVRMWSTWDLSLVRDVTTQSVHQPIVSIAFTYCSMVLYAATEGGCLVGWCRKDKEKEKQPLLITFLDTKSSSNT